MRRACPPLTFVADLRSYHKDAAAIESAGTHVKDSIAFINPDIARTSRPLPSEYLDIMAPLWSRTRFWSIWIDQDWAEWHESALAPLIKSLQSSPLSDLRALSFFEIVPYGLMSAILTHTPRLEILEIMTGVDLSTLPSLATHWQFKLRRLAFFGDDSALFFDLFAQSRETLEYLSVLPRSLSTISSLAACVAPDNRVKHLIIPTFTAHDRMHGDVSPLNLYITTFPRLEIVQLHVEDLPEVPHLLTGASTGVRHLWLNLREEEEGAEGLALLCAALRNDSAAIRHMRAIIVTDDRSSWYQHPLTENALADLRSVCRAKHIRITIATASEEKDDTAWLLPLT